ncbi:hypothetical protein P43SY_010317 [Pythium insidiosum]|uniref:Uncharacterized protein n=1 Tax=Pythium insidiosum TaxID=114742 RepID=A0AAD5LWB7_PYTIN|nr:hypothetical protein P43SY_010317 [Pythium insidiosum]
MAEDITWRLVTQAQIQTLAERHGIEDCSADLAEIFKIDADSETQRFLVDLQLHNYSYPLSILPSVERYADQVAVIVDYVAHSYYRHFHLYKCVFTPFDEIHIVQRNPNDVESPSTPRPLTDGFLHTSRGELPAAETEA